jgi:glyoxylase-like metal-dependent hydrolase (beta-lactamase superfamily II)
MFTRCFPHIKVFGHELTLKNLVDPSETCRVMARAMGHRWKSEFLNEVRAVPDHFLHELSDGECVKFGGERLLQCLYTPGHSDDHISIIDQQTNTIFTGDAFGLSYKQISNGKAIYCLPIGFDPDKAKQSLERIANIPSLKRAGICHYGWIYDLRSHAKSCQRFIDDVMTIARESGTVDKDLLRFYTEQFGQKAMKQWHRLRGGLMVNIRGIAKWREEHGINNPNLKQ